MKLALKKLHIANLAVLEKFEVTVQPPTARAVTAVENLKKAEMQLVPITTNVSLSKHVAPSAVDVGDWEHDLHFVLTPKIQLNETPTSVDAPTRRVPEFISPLFIVRRAGSNDAANCALMKTASDEFHIPVISNTKAVKKGG